MINRGKCTKCNTVVESAFDQDWQTCKCGEITVFGTSSMSPFGSEHFVRVDDLGNEITVKYVAHVPEDGSEDDPNKPEEGVTKHELIKGLETKIKNTLDRPGHVLDAPVSEYRLLTFMLDILHIFKKEEP